MAQERMVTIECEKHGTFEQRVWGWNNPRCEKCIEEEVEARRLEQRKRDEEEILERRRRWADESVPARYMNASISDFPDATIASILAWTKDSKTESGNLVIFGPVGTGKTHLAAAITRHLILNRTDAKYSSQANYLRQIRKTWDSQSESEDAVFQSFVLPRVLVLDDIGAARGNDNDTLRLGELIAERYDAMKPTVYVTNLTPETLKLTVGDRSYDRMRDKAVQLVLNGETRRKAA